MALRTHIPQRTCVACRQRRAKGDLFRLVRAPDSHVELDPTGKRQGRGMYLCRNPRCWEKALKYRIIERALRIKALQPEDRAALVQIAHQLEEQQR